MAFSIPFVSVVSLVVLAHLSCATRAQELSTPANEECWEDYVNLTAPIALTCTTPIADTMMLVGGISTCCQVEPPNATPVKGSNQVVGINLMYNANWDLVGNLSMNLRGASTCTSFRQKLVVTPAAQDANANSPATNVVTTYDPNTLAVVSVSTFTFPRRRAAIAATAFYTYVFGGVDAQGKPVFEIERSNGTAWETICVSTKPLCDCAVAVHEVEIFLVCSSCDTAGIGEEGVRNVFVSYWIETNTLMTVMDWPQQYGQGPMVSITGAAIAQYAVFVAFYLGNIWPVAYYWDLYLCQMHVMTTAWLTVPRITGSAFSAVDSIYYVGGQYFPQPNVTLNELTLNVGQLPVIETLVAQVYSRENNTFYVNEQVDVRCTAGLRLRISNSIDCRSVAPGTNDDNCNGPNTPLYMPVTQPLPIAFLCLARGTCAVPVGQRRQCGGDNETFRSCNREWGCCFDSVRQECFQYEIPQTQSDRVYFQTASLVTFSVVPLPVIPPAAPSTNSLANFARSTPGIIVFAAVGFVLCLSVFLIVKFGVAPRGMGSGNLSDGFDVIHGKYVVERKLGQGGFGQVFLVKRKTDGERFALKYIPCSSDEDRSFAIKEFELVRAAQGHPNMITIHDMFLNWSDDDLERSITQMVPKHGPTEPSISSPLVDANRRFVCIVMTYCPGGDLAQYIQKCVSENRRISEQWIMQTLARQMVAVLHHLHNRATPIIHRDLKPENVLLSLDRTSTMLTDFGLASQQDRTYMTTRAGSLHYVAPECWKKHYSSSVDLWAVGCILYATATGRVTVATARVMFNDAKEKGFQKEIRRELVEKYKYSDEFASFVLAFLQVDHKKRLTAQAATRWLDDLAAGIPRQTSNSSPNRSSSRPTPDVSRTISSGSVDSGPVTPDLDHTIVTPPLPTRQAADV